MIVVADASPLIFLGKIRRLDLINELYGRDIRVPRSVAAEVLSADAAPVEVETLKAFLRQCRVESVRRPRSFASAMSRADNDALTLSLRARADLLLCDDKLTRRMAEIEGIRPMGTLGILLNAAKQQILSASEAKALLGQLIEFHHFRISIAVYQAAIRALDAVIS